MILFVNVFLTDKPFYYISDRGRVGYSKDKLDVFKYTLASYSVIPWEHVVIYCELDEIFKHRAQELESFVQDLFPNCIFRLHRNTKQSEWKIAMEEIFQMPSDDLVWFTCNDDHPFVDYDLSLLNLITDRMKELIKQHPHVACQFSQWPLMVEQSNDRHTPQALEEPAKIIERQREYFLYYSKCVGSIQIVNRNLLRSWWFDHDYGDAFLPRTDAGGQRVKGPEDIVCICPYRELAAHYDGISYVDIDLNGTPPLVIPEGFFENDIKILYGATARKPGYVHVNPLVPNYFWTDPTGVDYRWVLEDIPLFWKKRISKIEVAQEIDPRVMVAHRNESIIKSVSYLWKSSRQELLEHIGFALRSADPSEPPLVLEVGEPLEPRHFPSIYKQNVSFTPILSIIVVEDTKQQDFLQTIESLLAQDVPRDSYEIIWVTVREINLRTMLSREVLKRADTVVVSNQIHNWAQGTYHLHQGRNEGAAFARGEYLHFTDTSAIYGPSFVKSILNEIKEKNGAASTSAWLHSHKKVLQRSDSSIADNQDIIASLTVSKELFVQCGGFDENPKYKGKAHSYTGLHERLVLKGTQVKEALPSLSAFTISLGETPGLTLHKDSTSPRGILPDVENKEISYLRDPASCPLGVSMERDVSLLLSRFNNALIEGKAIEEAIRIFTQQASKRNYSPLTSIAEALQELNRNQENARAQLLHSASTHYQHHELLALLATLFFVSRDHERALEFCKHSLSIDPTNLTARRILIELFNELKQETLLHETVVSTYAYFPCNPAIAKMVGREAE